MKLFSRTSNQFIQIIVFFVCLAIFSLTCKSANQIIPIPEQTETLPTPTIINMEIPLPINTLMICPPNFLTELPIPDVKENYIGQYILVTANSIKGLRFVSGQLVGQDNHMSNYVRNDKSHLLLWEKELVT